MDRQRISRPPQEAAQLRLGTEVLRRGGGPTHAELLRLLEAGEVGAANERARELAVSHPRDRFIHLARAVLAASEGDRDGALCSASDAVRLAPRWALARWLLATLHQKAGRIERALAILGRWDPASEPLRLLMLRANLHKIRGETDHALACAASAADRFADAPNGLRMMVDLTASSGAFHEAWRISTLAADRFPGDHAVWLQRAILAERRSDLAQIEIALRRCLEIAPHNPAARIKLIQRLAQAGETRAARQVEAELFADPDDFQPQHYAILLDVLAFLDSPLPEALVRRVAEDEGADHGSMVNALHAAALLRDWPRMAGNLSRILGHDGVTDRVAAVLAGHAGSLESAASSAGLPPVDVIVRKAELHALARNRADDNLSKAAEILARILDCQPAEDPGAPKVSYVCPIHRAEDAENLRAQIEAQDWRKAEVIFCINGPDVREEDLTVDPAKGFDLRFLRLPQGRPVGFYLQRSIDAATGEVLLRIDADDLYHADYTRLMVGHLRQSEADIVLMWPYCFHVARLGRSYLGSPVGDSPVEDLSGADRTKVGSGSSLAARREIFGDLGFDETLVLGEDRNFILSAIDRGLRVHRLPGFLHTATRKIGKSSHTWRADDFKVLGPDCRYVGAGSVVLTPDAPAGRPPIGDPFADLFSNPAFRPFDELRIDMALRSVPGRLRIIAGLRTPIAPKDDPLVQVTRDSPARVDDGALEIAFAPDDPDGERALSDRVGALSFCDDILPRLVLGQHGELAKLPGIARGDAAALRARFAEAGLRYAVLANPRSGSEHLCSLLGSIGLGRPRELLRSPAAALMSRMERPEEFLQTCLGGDVIEGVSATKIVSEYLFGGTPFPVAERILSWMVGEGFHFIRLRRPEMHSAVSDHMARHRGVWHDLRRRGRTAADAPGEAVVPPYDFEAISTTMRRFCDWSRLLDDVCARIIPHGRVINLTYRALTADPEKEICRLTRLLGFDPLPGSVPVSTIAPTSDTIPVIADYRKRFERDWQARGGR